MDASLFEDPSPTAFRTSTGNEKLTEDPEAHAMNQRRLYLVLYVSEYFFFLQHP